MNSIILTLVCVVGSNRVRLHSVTHMRKGDFTETGRHVQMLGGGSVARPSLASEVKTVSSPLRELAMLLLALNTASSFGIHTGRSSPEGYFKPSAPGVRAGGISAQQPSLTSNSGFASAQSHKPFAVDVTRRSLLNGLLAAPALFPLSSVAAEAAEARIGVERSRTFSVTEKGLKEKESAASLLLSDILLCGEHHNSASDHLLTRDLLVAMAEQSKRDGKPLTLGLEMFERAFQHVLDAYVAGDLSDDELYVKSEWKTRWVWSFKDYLPIFQSAKALGVPMIALNTDSEVLRKVPVYGLESLPVEKRNEYIPNPKNFVALTKSPYFRLYTDRVITESFATHMEMGLIESSATMGNFFAARILRDEAMATGMVKAFRSRGGRGLLLAGADHCKFRLGIDQRLRLASPVGTTINSVLLNPNRGDTLAETGFAVRLGPEPDAPLLADYVLFSQTPKA